MPQLATASRLWRPVTGPNGAQAGMASDFENEIVRSADINKLPISNRLATSSLALMVAHSIHSTDAVTLKSALAIDKKLWSAGNG